MSDSRAIQGLLRAVARRARANRLMQEVTDALGRALAASLVLALWNATAPRAWIIGLAGYGAIFVVFATVAAVRLGRRLPLSRAAAGADEAGQLHDEMKSAYWFVRHPERDDWVGEHVQRAADTARSLDARTLVPYRRPERLAWIPLCALGLIAITVLPVPRVFETMIDRIGEVLPGGDEEELGPVAELQEAMEDPERPAPRTETLEEQFALPRPGEEEQAGEDALEEQSADATDEPDPEASFTEGDEEGQEGEQAEGEGQQTEVDNPEDMPADSEGEQQPDPNASEQEGQGESTEESGTSMPAGEEVFLQEGGEEIEQMDLGEEEVGHATREGGTEQELDLGELETLDVQLQREILAMPEPEDEEAEPEELEELVTKVEKSLLEFRAVQAAQEFAMQDLLQSETVPWQYRQLVLTYFMSMRERDNQKEEERQ